MPKYSGEAIIYASYVTEADDKEQAFSFISDMAEEDFPDAEVQTVVNIEEI